MTRFLVDASALIALARVGELDVLRAFPAEVATTEEAFREAAHPGFPERDALTAAKAEAWLRVVPTKGDPASLANYGLGLGEASLFLAAEPRDVLVLDDRNARRFAEARRLPRTGTLGLLLAGVQQQTISVERGIAVLEKLGHSSFRMSVDLYQRTMQEMRRAAAPGDDA